MATLGGYVPNLRPDWLEQFVKVLKKVCKTCGHVLANHHHDFTDESRHCTEVEGCPCKQFVEDAK